MKHRMTYHRIYLLFTLGLLNAFLFAALAQHMGKGPSFQGVQKSIYETETAFQRMTREEGVKSAFVFYAADSAVLNRNEQLVKGKGAIADFYGSPMYDKAKVSWTPDHIEVSESGDLAYSYGKYVWSIPDRSGQVHEYTGIYLTIWKRQSDGSWKYIWD